MTEKPVREGLGGWLIIVGIGVVISPFLMAAQFIPLYTEIFNEGYWEVLTTPGSLA